MYLIGPAKLRLLSLQRKSRVLELNERSEREASEIEVEYSDLETRLE